MVPEKGQYIAPTSPTPCDYLDGLSPGSTFLVLSCCRVVFAPPQRYVRNLAGLLGADENGENGIDYPESLLYVTFWLISFLQVRPF